MDASKSFAKRPRWATPLTKKQWTALWKCQGKHPTLRQLKLDTEWHQQMRILYPDIEPCWECKLTARTLGLLA